MVKNCQTAHQLIQANYNKYISFPNLSEINTEHNIKSISNVISLQIIEDYDLNGLTIYSISDTWAPYLILEDCNEEGRQCTNSGYLKDYTDIIARHECNID
jgi:hypothetical protein